MKTIYALTATVAFCTLAFTASATIHRVNSNGTGDFTTPQAAHDAAVGGDTLHIEGKSGTYGNLILDRPLVVIGKGYFLDENLNLQASATVSELTQVLLDGGSEGSQLIGLTMGVVYMRASNTAVLRCHVTTILYISSVFATISDLEIRQNFFSHTGSGQGLRTLQLSNPASNVVIANNLFESRIFIPVGVTGVLINNVFTNGFGVSLVGFQVESNIMTAGTYTAPNSTTINNISVGTQFGTMNGNQSNVPFNDIFVASGTKDGKYQLNGSSTATGAGSGGVDAGAFGNSDPYRLSGIPPIPTIYALTAVVNGNTLNVTVSTRSNN